MTRRSKIKKYTVNSFDCRVLVFIVFLCLTQLAITACGGSAGSGGSDGTDAIGAGGGGGTGDESAASGGDSSSSGGADTGGGYQAGTLTAGDIDDNLNYTAFQNYIDSVQQADTYQIFPDFQLEDRITIYVSDINGEGYSNAQLRFTDSEDNLLLDTSTSTNGYYYFFPVLDLNSEDRIVNVTVSPPELETPAATVVINLDDLNPERRIDIALTESTRLLPDALDIMFVIDATGSMGDELNFLKIEFESIVENIQLEYSHIAMRFGLVVYRDTGDSYITRSFEFTDSVSVMNTQLAEQIAEGGGDYPEAMEQAMADAMNAQWRSGNTARMLFLVADAPPHNENIATAFTTSLTARERGIHIFPLAASGVAETAEALMRVMAVVTHGRYLFLTDDSGIGNPHAVPAIPCYVVTRLDHLMMRSISSVLSGRRIEPTPDEIIRTIGVYNSGICEEIAN